MALTMRPDFPAVEGNTTRGDFVIAWDDRLKVVVLGDCRTQHMTWLPAGDGDYERAVALADRAKREGLALVDDWVFDAFTPCAECGRPIDARSTICRSCARLRGTFDSARAREAGRRSAAKRWGNRGSGGTVTDADVRARVSAALRASLNEPPPDDDPGQAILSRRLARRLGVI